MMIPTEAEQKEKKIKLIKKSEHERKSEHQTSY